MKFDFESLSSEPLFYMLMHSGAFVCVLGFVFFVIGLLFGRATWGRYKRISRELRAEAEVMKEEIAGLKRKIGELAVKSGPAVVMATETIHMPKKEGAPAAGSPAPAAAEVAPPESLRSATTQTAKTPIKERLPNPNVIKAKLPSPSAPPPSPAVPSPQGSLAESTSTGGGVPAESSAPGPAAASVTLSPSEIPPPPARHGSPLAAIIATPPAKEEPKDGEENLAETAGLLPTDALPELIELPVAPLPAVEIQPELDPRLGLVYKQRPQHVDDLTALKGIARGLEKRLHEFGIYTYAQIAAWDEDRIKEFSTRLSFKDRIHREHWVEQARELVEKQPKA